MKFFSLSMLISCMVACLHQPPVRTGLEGKPLPSFKLLLSDSATYVNTSTIPLGQPVIFFYYSPQCPYCRAQMQDMIDNIKSLKNTRLYVITAWPLPQMKSFVSNYKVNKFPNVVAGADITRFFESYFSFSGVPFTAVYGKDKRLKEVFMGRTGVTDIKEALDE